MGLGLCFGVRLCDRVTLERQGVTGIGICEDSPDLANSVLGQTIGGDGTIDAIVADMMGDNPALATAIDCPNYCPLTFF